MPVGATIWLDTAFVQPQMDDPGRSALHRPLQLRLDVPYNMLFPLCLLLEFSGKVLHLIP
jgi:hypothetical protein